MKGGCKVYFGINRIVLVRESKKIIFKRELVGMSENIYFCDILQICEGMASLEILRKFLSNKGGNCWSFFSFLFFVLWFKTLLYFNHHQKKREKLKRCSVRKPCCRCDGKHPIMWGFFWNKRKCRSHNKVTLHLRLFMFISAII